MVIDKPSSDSRAPPVAKGAAALPVLRDRLSASLRTIRTETEGDPATILLAVEFLVACGRTEEASVGLRRAVQLLQTRGIRFASTEVLQTACRRLEAARVHQKVAAMGELAARLFANDEEAVLCPAPNSRVLLVVFGSMHGDLWLSYPVLHALLPSETTTILYLKDPAAMMFLTGLSCFGAGFDALCAGIRRLASENGISDIRAMGYSSGGFGGLLAAAHLGATSYLGLSIRTDLDPQSALPKDRYVDRPDLLSAARSLMIDLKPLVEQGHPRRGVLCYGARSRIDEAHAAITIPSCTSSPGASSTG
jgi:hypothetical protein